MKSLSNNNLLHLRPQQEEVACEILTEVLIQD